MAEANRITLEQMGKLPLNLRKTLTRDRGSENFGWRELEEKLNRGPNENINGLIRRFFPKGTDFRKITNEEIQRVEYLLNTRPRKRLGGLTPVEVLFKETGVALYS